MSDKQNTYLYVCSFFPAQLTTVIQPNGQWHVLSGSKYSSSLNQLVANILGDHLLIAILRPSPQHCGQEGMSSHRESAGEWKVCSHWDRDGQTAQEWFFSSGKRFLMKTISMISCGIAGRLHTKCCHKPAHWSCTLSFNSISLTHISRQNRTHEKQHLLKSTNWINTGSTKDISLWHSAPFWQGSNLFTAPVLLQSWAKLSLPYQAVRWLWRRRTTNTLLPSAGHHKETLLDLNAKWLPSLTAWGF